MSRRCQEVQVQVESFRSAEVQRCGRVQRCRDHAEMQEGAEVLRF